MTRFWGIKEKYLQEVYVQHAKLSRDDPEKMSDYDRCDYDLTLEDDMWPPMVTLRGTQSTDPCYTHSLLPGSLDVPPGFHFRFVSLPATCL